MICHTIPPLARFPTRSIMPADSSRLRMVYPFAPIRLAVTGREPSPFASAPILGLLLDASSKTIKFFFHNLGRGWSGDSVGARLEQRSGVHDVDELRVSLRPRRPAICDMASDQAIERRGRLYGMRPIIGAVRAHGGARVIVDSGGSHARTRARAHARVT